MRLDPLPPASAVALLQALLGDDPSLAPLKRLLIERTEGNPFFLEESVRALVETGVLAGEPGAYRLTRPLLDIAVPATVQAVLAARVDRLPPDAKRLLQTAAVIGTEVPLSLLQTVADMAPEMLHRSLAQLQGTEFLYETHLFPERVYTFKHALTQNVAYQSLLTSTRQQVHRQIAQALETLFPETVETQPEILAHHYTEAALPESAVAYWQRAGQRALARSANQETIAHLRKGLGLLKALAVTPERAQQELSLQTALASVFIAVKGMGAAEVKQAYTRALELCQQVGDPAQLLQVLQGLRRFYTGRTNHQRVREIGAQLLHLGQSQQDPAVLQEAHLALGWHLQTEGELSASRLHLEQGMALYSPQRIAPWLCATGGPPGVTSRNFVILTLWLLGYPDQALQRSHEALSLAQALSHPYSLVLALSFAARCHVLRREARAAQERAEAAMVICTAQGFAPWLAEETLMPSARLGSDHAGTG